MHQIYTRLSDLLTSHGCSHPSTQVLDVNIYVCVHVDCSTDCRGKYKMENGHINFNIFLNSKYVE